MVFGKFFRMFRLKKKAIIEKSPIKEPPKRRTRLKFFIPGSNPIFEEIFKWARTHQPKDEWRFKKTVYDQIKEDEKGLEECWMRSLEELEKDNRFLVKSFYFDFGKHLRDLRYLVGTNLRASQADIKAKKLIVVGGYGGHFSKALKSSGFNVVHTDPIERYAKSVEGTKIEWIQAAGHKIPFIEEALAYVCFEVPAFNSDIGTITVYKAMAETEKGLIDISTESYDPMRPISILFSGISRIYGCVFRTSQKGPFTALNLSNKKASRAKFKVDLAVLTEMAKLEKPEYLAYNIARRLEINEEIVKRSLKRIYSIIILHYAISKGLEYQRNL